VRRSLSPSDTPDEKKGGPALFLDAVQVMPRQRCSQSSPVDLEGASCGLDSCAPTSRLPEALSSGGSSAASVQPASLLSQLRVLLVDDDALLRKLMAKRLRKNGVVHLTTAENGAVAWSAVKQRWWGVEGGGQGGEQFHVIITDETMPVMLGSELCTKIRTAAITEGRPCPLMLAVTGNGLPSDVAQLQSAGAHKVFTKPVVEDALVAELRRHAEALL